MFISHDLKGVRALAHGLLVLRGGKAIERGSAERMLSRPETDYTRELISSSS